MPINGPRLIRRRFKIGTTARVISQRQAALLAEIETLLQSRASRVPYVVGLIEYWRHRETNEPLTTVIITNVGQVCSREGGNIMTRDFLETNYIKTEQ